MKKYLLLNQQEKLTDDRKLPWLYNTIATISRFRHSSVVKHWSLVMCSKALIMLSLRDCVTFQRGKSQISKQGQHLQLGYVEFPQLVFNPILMVV